MVKKILVCLLVVLLLTGCAYITKTNNEIENLTVSTGTNAEEKWGTGIVDSDETSGSLIDEEADSADSSTVKGAESNGTEGMENTESSQSGGIETTESSEPKDIENAVSNKSEGKESTENNESESGEPENTESSEPEGKESTGSSESDGTNNEMAESITGSGQAEAATEDAVSQTVSSESNIIPLTGNSLDVSLLPAAGRDIIFEGLDPISVQQIEEILDSFDKDISLVVYSTAGNKMIFYNTEQSYFSACTIKIAWMLYLCKCIDDGAYNKEELRAYEERHYHDGSGTIRKGEFGDTYTIERLINLCMSVSDNVAYKMLREVIDKDAFRQYITELGYNTFLIKDSTMWSSHAMVKDYIGIWNEVYKYLEGGSEGAAILKNACTNTPFAYGVRTLEHADYSHKSGDNFGASCAYHDAGLVWADTPYLYAVFSKCEGEPIYEEKIDSAMTIVHELFGGNIAEVQLPEYTGNEE